MEPAHSIRKLGFRRWHERQLLESFAWLTTCLLCAIVIAAVLELIGLHTPGLTPLITLAIVYVVGLMAYTAWKRFVAMLLRAQHYANHSTCERCGCYGRFDVLTETARMPVRCRACGHEWVLQ